MTSRVRQVTLLVLLSAGTAWTQVPAGGEFRVNTSGGTFQFYQYAPAAAVDAAGRFVVVWVDDYGPVRGQRYDTAGVPQGAEFTAVSFASRTFPAATAASDAAGNFVVAAPQDYGIWARRFDASGTQRGLEFKVNTYWPGHYDYIHSPSIASDAAGNLVFVWSSFRQDGDRDGIFGQRYDAYGSRRGVEFRVNTYTTGNQQYPFVTSNASGDFVVAWRSDGQDGSLSGVFAQRYDASGAPRGIEFQVNVYTTGYQAHWSGPRAACDAAGNFVVVWQSRDQDGDGEGVFGRRYDASGLPLGPEFQVNSYTTGVQGAAFAATDASGNFVVAWTSPDGDSTGVFARRYDQAGAPRGNEFRVNTYTWRAQEEPAVASDPAGNLVIAWSGYRQDGRYNDIYAQRYGGLVPAALWVDPNAGAVSDGNDVLEAGEVVAVRPWWRNVNGATQTFGGTGLSFSGPAAAGVSYQLVDAGGDYGAAPNGATVVCSDCYEVGVGASGTRPSTHWDATFTERLTPDALGQTKPWAVHVGESFVDVPRASPYYRFVETLLHKGVTGGCAADSYCPASAVTREQLSVFVLTGKEGAGYLPTACGTPVFEDVPATSPFCRYVEELVRRGVVSGCGGGNYCPGSPVTREQMPVFVLKVLEPASDPPACGTPVFGDVPASSPYCRFIEDLARRGVVSGCGGGNYCPSDPVTREQMAVFISATFGLTLYGP